MSVNSEYQLGKAESFSEVEKNRFREIVISAEQVAEATFDGLMKNNPILLFIPNTTAIKAVGALKIPNESYKKKVFSNSKTTENPENYEYELGWIVSKSKGCGKRIVEILTSVAVEKYSINPNIYTTVKEDNEKMKHILEKYGFKKSGCFKSDRGEYNVELYLKNKN